MKVPNLHGPGKPIPVMAGGLGLAAASVSVAYFLQIVLTTCRWKGH